VDQKLQLWLLLARLQAESRFALPTISLLAKGQQLVSVSCGLLRVSD
jgi:hypothetical protein